MNRRRMEQFSGAKGFRPFFENEEAVPVPEIGYRSQLYKNEAGEIPVWFYSPTEATTAEHLFEKRYDRAALKRITIIGSGASGTLLAANLLRTEGNRPLEINLVEKKEKIGVGVAYASESDCNLLNVPACNMSAFADDAGHFCRWLAENSYDYQPADFVPRRIYGAYLRALLSEAIHEKRSSVKINIIDDEAVDILCDEDAAMVILKSGEILFSHKVILAFGNFTPSCPPVKDLSFTAHEKYFQNPWEGEIYEKIHPQDSVLIIGTGLSMVDVVLNLHRSAHRGKIFAVSTHGLLPAVHQSVQELPPFNEEIVSQFKISGILKIVRGKIKENEISWRFKEIAPR